MFMPSDPGLIHSSLENVYWGIVIVTYPYISGLVAGSFVVGSLSHLFGQKTFARLSPIAVLVTFALLLAAPMTVLSDSRQPVNFIEMYTRGHVPYSPIGDFVVIWTAYVILMLFELFYTFRWTCSRLATEGGARARLMRVLALGRVDASEGRRAKDGKVLVALSAIGIVLAFMFHGYIGFIFGVVKARPLWTTPLMPVLFIVSAIVSGIALMLLIQAAISWWQGHRPNGKVMQGLLTYLVLFLLIDFFLDVVDFLNASIPEYTSLDTAQGFQHIYLHGPLTFTYLGLQITLGILIPLVLYLIPRVRRSLLGQLGIGLAVLIGVYAMRWDVVIGGQLQSKISENLLVFTPEVFGYGSIQVVIGIFFVAIVLFELVAWLFPWREAADDAEREHSFDASHPVRAQVAHQTSEGV